MKETFRWNAYADQPHNVAPRKERFRHHLRFLDGYAALLWANLRKSIPVLYRYRKYKKRLYRIPAPLKKPFGIAASLAGPGGEEVLESLRDLGVKTCIFRVPSWEQERFPEFEKFFNLLYENGIDVTIALLQRREDVLDPIRWEAFVSEVFSRFGQRCPYFEVGHAWNRTKWGVWDYREYIQLAHAVFSEAERYTVGLVGPAVIDFEFHLYPSVLRFLPFDKVSSLLYVDRVGPPENTQYGWDTSKKVALLKAVVDKCSQRGKELWITEVNWPLIGTGKYSPASGKPNVSEDEQANYLVRYYILALATGFVERVYWWQLAAPGYGLIDTRGELWRKRPSFFALKTMVEWLEGSVFEGRFVHPEAEIFVFCKRKTVFAVCWTRGPALEYSFPGRLTRVVNRDGQEIPVRGNTVPLDASPKYVLFDSEVALQE